MSGKIVIIMYVEYKYNPVGFWTTLLGIKTAVLPLVWITLLVSGQLDGRTLTTHLMY